MPKANRLQQTLSNFVGAVVAAVLVWGLIVACCVSSDAYAVQKNHAALQSMTVEQLKEFVLPLRKGLLPPEGAQSQQTIAALVQLGNEQNDIDARVDALAITQANVENEYGAAAQLALINLGADAIPPLRSMLGSDSIETYARACTAINLMGASAKELVPDLITRVRDGDERVSALALFAFENLADHALPILETMKETLIGREFHGQIYICKICMGLGSDAAPMARELEDLFKNGNISARSWAGIALGAIGPVEDVDTVGLLVTRIDAFAQVDKERALMALAQLGPEAETAKDDVRSVMLDKRSRVRAHAAYAYYRITDDAATSATVLGDLLAQRYERETALFLLGKMGPDAATAIPQVEPFLDSDSIVQREAAVQMIGRVGPQAIGSREKVSRLANHPDPLLRVSVREALDAIDGKTVIRDDQEATP